jgi:hypothetical protein
MTDVPVVQFNVLTQHGLVACKGRLVFVQGQPWIQPNDECHEQIRTLPTSIEADPLLLVECRDDASEERYFLYRGEIRAWQ